MDRIERSGKSEPESLEQKNNIDIPYDYSIEKKLYITKDIEGVRNKEIIDTVKELSEKLEEQDSRVVGIAPYGSTVRGYSIKGESDADMYVLYDDSVEKDMDELDTGRNNETIVCQTEDTFDKIYKRNKKTSSIKIAVNAININPELIKMRGDLNYYMNIEAYASIFLIVTGKKIDDYRKYWAARVSEMSEDQRNNFIDNSVQWLTHYADFNTRKLVKRKHISIEKLNEITKIREELWRKRLKHLLKIK